VSRVCYDNQIAMAVVERVCGFKPLLARRKGWAGWERQAVIMTVP
jgi:hypothetical protein